VGWLIEYNVLGACAVLTYTRFFYPITYSGSTNANPNHKPDLEHLHLVGHPEVISYLYNMKSIVITPRNKSEFEFVSSLVIKLGLASRTLSLEDNEDAGLGILMGQVNRSSTVKKSTILKNLQ
jgi:hypothetical protein